MEKSKPTIDNVISEKEGYIFDEKTKDIIKVKVLEYDTLYKVILRVEGGIKEHLTHIENLYKDEPHASKSELLDDLKHGWNTMIVK